MSRITAMFSKIFGKVLAYLSMLGIIAEFNGLICPACEEPCPLVIFGLIILFVVGCIVHELNEA